MAAAGTLAARQAEEGIPRPRRPHRPVALFTISSLVAAVLALPLVFLLIEAQGAGASEVAHLIFRPLTGRCCGTRSGSPSRSPWRAR